MGRCDRHGQGGIHPSEHLGHWLLEFPIMASGQIWNKNAKTGAQGPAGHFRIVYRNDTLEFCGIMVHKKALPGSIGHPFQLCSRS